MHHCAVMHCKSYPQCAAKTTKLQTWFLWGIFTWYLKFFQLPKKDLTKKNSFSRLLFTSALLYVLAQFDSFALIPLIHRKHLNFQKVLQPSWKKMIEDWKRQASFVLINKIKRDIKFDDTYNYLLPRGNYACSKIY